MRLPTKARVLIMHMHLRSPPRLGTGFRANFYYSNLRSSRRMNQQGTFHDIWPCGCDAPNLQIEEADPTIVLDAAFGGGQNAGARFRPATRKSTEPPQPRIVERSPEQLSRKPEGRDKWQSDGTQRGNQPRPESILQSEASGIAAATPLEQASSGCSRRKSSTTGRRTKRRTHSTNNRTNLQRQHNYWTKTLWKNQGNPNSRSKLPWPYAKSLPTSRCRYAQKFKTPSVGTHQTRPDTPPQEMPATAFELLHPKTLPVGTHTLRVFIFIRRANEHSPESCRLLYKEVAEQIYHFVPDNFIIDSFQLNGCPTDAVSACPGAPKLLE